MQVCSVLQTVLDRIGKIVAVVSLTGLYQLASRATSCQICQV